MPKGTPYSVDVDWEDLDFLWKNFKILEEKRIEKIF